MINIYSPSKKIVRDGVVVPNFFFDLDGISCEF